MRQMDTILVAVGVPTKVPGASIALPQPVTITEGTVDIPGQTPNEQQETETQTDTYTEESGAAKEVAETDEMGDGWDIPDISDLLNSLNDTESEGQMGVRNSLPHASEENATNDNTTSAFSVCDDVEGADPDNEHISWSWDDTHWTTEHTHKQRQPNL